jgi:hypothetical protein
LKSPARCDGRSKIFAFLVIFLLLISTGCAKNAIKNVSDEEVLRERVMEYWNHKVNEEFDKSYEYEDPLFRKTYTMVNYIRSFGAGRAKWVGARIQGITMEGDTAKVSLMIKLKLVVSSSGSVSPESMFEEKWTKVDGIWYHVNERHGVQQRDN